MLRPYDFAFALTVSLSLSAAACTSTPDDVPAERPLAIHTDDGCRGECGVVSDSSVRLFATAHGDLAKKRLSVEVSDVASARIASTKVDVCNEGPTPCLAYAIDVATLAAGDVSVVFMDEAGNRVDAMPISVRDPAKLVATVKAEGPRQSRRGRHIVFRDAPIELDVIVQDSSELLLRYASPPWTLTSSDDNVVAPDGSSPTKARARALGSATLTLHANGVVQPLELDIVER